jgi:tetratricopeptide (TPR) repeat protein
METEISSEAYYNQGIMEYEEGQYELSIENFKKAIEIDDAVFDYHYNLGLAYIKTEDYDSAIKSFNQGASINAKDTDLYVNLGLAFYSKGDFDKAAKAYKKAVMINSTDPENCANAGIAYCALKNWKEAIFYFKQAVKQEPKNADYNYNLAYAYFEAEKYESAEEYLINVLNYDRQKPDAYFLLGKVNVKQHDFIIARENFNKVLALEPDRQDAIDAIEEIDNRKTRKPKESAENNVDAPPRKETETNVAKLKNIEIEAENYFNTATKLMEKKEYEAAIAEFKKTLSLVNNHPEAIRNINLATRMINEATELFNQGLSHFFQNDYISAVNFLEKAQSIYPAEKTKKLLGEAVSKNKQQSKNFIKSGKYDLAVESLKTTLKENPEDAEAHFTLGNVYLEQAEYNLALESLSTTIHLDPDNKEAQDAVFHVIKELNTCHNDIDECIKLSISYINKKEYQNAVNCLKKVLDYSPDNAKAKALLVKISELQNQTGLNK